MAGSLETSGKGTIPFGPCFEEANGLGLQHRRLSEMHARTHAACCGFFCPNNSERRWEEEGANGSQ